MNQDLSGLWKANLEKSKLLGPAPKGILAKIHHTEPEFVVEMFITKSDDSEDRMSFKGRTTGEEIVNQVHSVKMRSRSRWEGTELLIESWLNVGGRDGHFRDYWFLSSDGQTLTMEHRDDDLTGQITFFERVRLEAESASGN
jgi:hypothetical protein